MSAPLVCLVYVSRSVRELGEDELLALLQASRENNRRLDVTGVLVYDGARFAQVLEGTEAAIQDVFSRIAVDRRHFAVRVLADEPVMRREFEDWRMGFRRVSGADLSRVDGFSVPAADALERRVQRLPDAHVPLDELLPVLWPIMRPGER